MFQTEPIIYLQSLGNEWFTSLIILVTTLGSSAFLVAITLITTFGVDFKKGFLLFQLLMWTGLITGILKILIAFPRPDFVDNRVLNLEYGIKNTSPFRGDGPEGIFKFPDRQALKAFRLQGSILDSPFGFPSGHVALTTALWGASASIFNSKIIRTLAPVAIIAVAFSRMYLGRHFLGDVIGGTLIGLTFVVIFAYFLKSPFKDSFFKTESFKFALKPQNLFFCIFMFALPAFFTFTSLVSPDISGLFLGANAAYLLILKRGIPGETGNGLHKAARVFIALGLFGTSSLLLDFLFEPIGTTNHFQFSLVEFVKYFIPAFTIWISVVICTKLNLYRENDEAGRQTKINTRIPAE